MQREPPPFVWAIPDEKNILTCEYMSQAFCAPLTAEPAVAGNYIIVRPFFVTRAARAR